MVRLGYECSKFLAFGWSKVVDYNSLCSENLLVGSLVQSRIEVWVLGVVINSDFGSWCCKVLGTRVTLGF